MEERVNRKLQKSVCFSLTLLYDELFMCILRSASSGRQVPVDMYGSQSSTLLLFLTKKKRKRKLVDHSQKRKQNTFREVRSREKEEEEGKESQNDKKDKQFCHYTIECRSALPEAFSLSYTEEQLSVPDERKTLRV